MADGLSRLSRTHLSLKLMDARNHLIESIKQMRLGGDGVLTGADYIESPVMDNYRAVMYQVSARKYSLNSCFVISLLPLLILMVEHSLDVPGVKIHQTVP